MRVFLCATIGSAAALGLIGVWAPGIINPIVMGKLLVTDAIVFTTVLVLAITTG